MGFRKQRGTMDDIVLLNKLIEEGKSSSEKNKMYAFFADLKGAFDKVNREKLWKIVEEEGVNKELVQEMKMLFEETKCEIKVNGEIIGEFWTKQGCPLSEILFISYASRSEKRLSEQMGAGVKI